MRWRDKRRSTNVEDRRGQRAVGGGLKIGGGMGLLLLLLVVLTGGDPSQVLQLLAGGGAGSSGAASGAAPGAPAPNDEMGEFLSTVLASTEDVWGAVFRQGGATYAQPKLVLFDESVRSACGFNTAATGPFYCPGDRQLYLDTSFFRELERMGGAGDFAMAYVVGHEIGHHIQTVTGTSTRVRELQARSRSQAGQNQIQVLMELQADCYAGVWAYHANRSQSLLDPGDAEEGLAAAAAIGDDRLLRRAGQRVSPESFTHGSSEQRQQWLARGMQTGDVDSCDTFAAAGL